MKQSVFLVMCKRTAVTWRSNSLWRKEGYTFFRDKTIIKVKYKNDKNLKEDEISNLLKKDGWKKENNRMIFYKKQSYVEVISTNEDYYEILYKHM